MNDDDGLITRAKRVMQLIESGEVRSFVAVIGMADGGVKSVAFADPKWARRAMEIVMSQLPPPKEEWN